MQPPDPLLCSIFALVALALAGVAQTIWLKSDKSRRFAVAIDGGRTWRGRRILGDNKTWRGFVLMVPAVGVSFLVARAMLMALHDGRDILWPLSTVGYFLLGSWTGFGFMLGEFPNSFIKRQCEIAPGAPALGHWSQPFCFVVDQLDSIGGGLIALSLVVPVPLWTWLHLLVVGAIVHWGFNVVFVMIGLKTRAA
jgi:CDP-2,3-bis-(O-geranylgeranyl)-sn-glycerol synthase